MKNNSNNKDENNKDTIEPIKISKNIKKIDLSQYLNNNKSNRNNKINENKMNNNQTNIILEKNNNNKIIQEYNNDLSIKKDINNTPSKSNEDSLNRKINNNKINNDFFNNINATTLKITKSREIDINEIKNSRLGIISKRNFSKTITNKNLEKEKNDLIIKDLNNSIFLNRKNMFSKKTKNKKSMTSNSFNPKNIKNNFEPNKKDIKIKDFSKLKGNSNRHNSFNNLKTISKNRKNSISNDKKRENINKQIKADNNTHNKIEKKDINIYFADDNKKSNKNKINLKNLISPNSIKKLKIINIPIGKNKRNRNDYNSNTYDANSNRDKNLRTKNFVNNKIFLDNSNLNDEKKYNSNSNTINTSFVSFHNKELEELDTKINILTNNSRQIFCYYRLYNSKNIELNLLENSPKNFEIFGFSKGNIFLNLKTDTFKFISKNNNSSEICNKLSNIVEIEIEPYMINIIKIHSIYLNINEKKNCQSLDFNNLMKIEEIAKIPIEQNDKIKAALCNNFSFNLIINSLYERKIECIINNFDIYLFLIKLFDTIVEYHKNKNYSNIICNNDIIKSI